MAFLAKISRINAVQQRFASTSEVSFQTKPYKLHRLDNGPCTDVTLNSEDAMHYYTSMQTIRRLEIAAGNLYKERKVRGFCHTYSGQEACAVGIKATFEDKDAIISSYRVHGLAYLMGSTLKDVICELTGKLHGNVRGKGGSMHMYGENFYGGNGIVGAQVPLGAGVALAYKLRRQSNFVLTLYGDGAANQGQVFEAMNMAKLWSLPCVFVCENNGYGMGTSADRSSASVDYYTRGDYIPGIWVDGMDVLAVREVFRWAREYCTKGNGPLTVEVATYRYGGHSMSDPGTSYRSRDEVQEVRKTRDPIVGFKDRIISANLVTEDQVKAIDKQARQAVDEAVEFAANDEILPIEGIYSDIYSTPVDNHSVRGVTVDDTVVPRYYTTKQMLQAVQ